MSECLQWLHHEGRRVGKQVWRYSYTESIWRLMDSYRYLYDGWDMVLEMKAVGDIATTAAAPNPSPTHVPCRAYAWGTDLSGTRRGAGGVGGLLAVRQFSVAATRVKVGSAFLTVSGALTSATLVPTYDHNGNVRRYMDLKATTANPSTAWSMEYDAFGQEISLTGGTLGGGATTATPPFRFSTKYTDAETELVYYGYRYYNPEFGRWISRDPIGERGGINLYGMVGNDAVNRWDVLGLAGEPVIGDCEGKTCSITLYVGHNTTTATALNNRMSGLQAKPDPCIKYGSVSCFNCTGNGNWERLMPENSLTGLDDAMRVRFGNGEISALPAPDPNRDGDVSIAMAIAKAEISKTARGMCGSPCRCTVIPVTVSVIQYANPNLRRTDLFTNNILNNAWDRILGYGTYNCKTGSLTTFPRQ